MRAAVLHQRGIISSPRIIPPPVCYSRVTPASATGLACYTRRAAGPYDGKAAPWADPVNLLNHFSPGQVASISTRPERWCPLKTLASTNGAFRLLRLQDCEIVALEPEAPGVKQWEQAR